jgi:two-component system, NtrC family, sensor kinase
MEMCGEEESENSAWIVDSRGFDEHTAMENVFWDDKEFYKSLLRNSAVPTFVIDSHHRIIIWNSACEKLTGVMESEVLGTDNQWRPFYDKQRPTLADLVVDNNPHDISVHYTVHRTSNMFAEGLQAEGWYADLGGKTRYIFFEAAPIHNRNGELIAAIETLQDITERKLAEREILKSRAELLVKHEQLKNLFQEVKGVKEEWVKTMDCLGDIIIVTDDNGRIKQCNRAMRELVDKPHSVIIGKLWTDLIPIPQPADGNVCIRAMEFFHHLSEKWFDINIYSSRESNETNVSGMIITLHDSTEARRMHRDLEKAYIELKATHSQMLQADKMASIGQLAAGVAHEINNPIGFISSNLTSLGKYVERVREFIAMQSGIIASGTDTFNLKELAEARKSLKIDYIMDDIGQLVSESLDGADRVRNIVQDLKSFSRVDEAECKLVNLIECLETTINMVRSELKYKVTLRKEYGEVPLTMCHPQQLNQVFINLLINAAQAIETQGEITVACQFENGSIFVAVRDNGCGIPKDNLRRLFEPFFTTKDVGQGTGLGLSISYDIIKKHNGEIKVQSEVGQGTIFTVRIPVVGRGQHGGTDAHPVC